MAGRFWGSLLVTACLASSSAAALSPSAVVGKVRDRVSHKPLAGCYVRLTKPELANGLLVLRTTPMSSTVTDSNGVFVFRNSAPGPYWLEIGDASHLPVYEHIASSKMKDTLAIALERDGSGLPVPSRPLPPPPPPPPPPAPPPPPTRKLAGPILFRVTDLNGKPIRDASVCFDQVGRNVGVTDSLGRYECRGMWAENKEILVRADGYADYFKGFQLREGKSESIDVHLAPKGPGGCYNVKHLYR
jgi:carboxypeptidase family protein